MIADIRALLIARGPGIISVVGYFTVYLQYTGEQFATWSIMLSQVGLVSLLSVGFLQRGIVSHFASMSFDLEEDSDALLDETMCVVVAGCMLCIVTFITFYIFTVIFDIKNLYAVFGFSSCLELLVLEIFRANRQWTMYGLTSLVKQVSFLGLIFLYQSNTDPDIVVYFNIVASMALCILGLLIIIKLSIRKIKRYDLFTLNLSKIMVIFRLGFRYNVQGLSEMANLTLIKSFSGHFLEADKLNTFIFSVDLAQKFFVTGISFMNFIRQNLIVRKTLANRFSFINFRDELLLATVLVIWSQSILWFVVEVFDGKLFTLPLVEWGLYFVFGTVFISGKLRRNILESKFILRKPIKSFIYLHLIVSICNIFVSVMYWYLFFPKFDLLYYGLALVCCQLFFITVIKMSKNPKYDSEKSIGF